MTETKWKLKFINFQKALLSLKQALIRDWQEDFVIQAGIIKNFEFTFELAWKTLKEKLEFDGFIVNSPRETLKQGLANNYFSESEIQIWFEALEYRNILAHTCDQEISQRSIEMIENKFLPIFFTLEQKLLS